VPGYPPPTTSLSPSVSGCVTITHPHPPLYRQQVEVIRQRRGADPDFIVRLPDGQHVAVAMSWTDYAGVSEPPTTLPLTLLALASLRHIVRLRDHWRPGPPYDAGSSTCRSPRMIRSALFLSPPTPSQVWSQLTAECRHRASWCVAQLALNRVAAAPDRVFPEVTHEHPDPPPQTT
jgi:hypothetical protein